jgi:ABC-type lipoprotein export system ATPase subunit
MQIVDQLPLLVIILQIKNVPKGCYRNTASDVHSESAGLNGIINLEVKNGKFIAIVGRSQSLSQQ